MKRRDDIFDCAGVTWQRLWAGDHFRWEAPGGVAVGWSRIVYEHTPTADGSSKIEGRREYYAEVGGRRVREDLRSTRAAMEAAVKVALVGQFRKQHGEAA